jgi:hypothetical protein
MNRFESLRRHQVFLHLPLSDVGPLADQPHNSPVSSKPHADAKTTKLDETRYD